MNVITAGSRRVGNNVLRDGMINTVVVVVVTIIVAGRNE
jgi:hypothetical protein